MNLYTLPDGSQVLASDQFQVGDQKYPAGWLSTAGDAEIASLGITVQELPDPPPGPVVLPARQFRQLFTQAEVAAITTAAQSSVQLRIFMDDEAAAGTVNMGDPEVVAGINALVGAGLLSQDRATKVLAAQPA